MNIFVLSECPIEAAQMQCDKHVVKMIVETAQRVLVRISGRMRIILVLYGQESV